MMVFREQIDHADIVRERQNQRMSEALLGFVDESKSWQADLIDSIHANEWQPHRQHDVESFSAKLSGVTVEQREQLIKLRILELLRFSEMADRYEAIPDVYKKTFQWIFDEPGVSEESRNSTERHD